MSEGASYNDWNCIVCCIRFNRRYNRYLLNDGNLILQTIRKIILTKGEWRHSPFLITDLCKLKILNKLTFHDLIKYRDI